MKTIIDLFEESVETYSKNPFLWEKKTDKYIPTTFAETRELVKKLAASLIKRGVNKGDRIALLSEGRNNWVISELAILYTGAADVPLSIKLNAEFELKFRLEHSGSRMIFVSGGQAEKIDSIIDELPNIETIVLLDEKESYSDREVYIGELFKEGEAYLNENPTCVDEAAGKVKGDDFANITYTSGTTADPKGIILSHRNYTANVEQSLSLMRIPDYYRTLTILPLDHCFAHVAGIYSFMASGGSIATVQSGKTPMETLKNIPKNIKEIKPHILLSVPALAKNFRKNIEAGIRAKGPTAEKMFNFAMKLAYSYNKEGYNKGGFLHFWKKPLLSLFDKILFSKIRENFGGNLQFFIGGGALLDIELQRFFYAIGMPMFQGYGLSEATPVISSNSPIHHKLGSSGYLVDPIDLKILDDDGNEMPIGQKGEIVVRGENVMLGYWKNDKATAETVRNGWLHTGDLGYMDKDGFLYVLGRFKSLLISSDGEKYSPESIEEAFTEQSPLIDQVMLHNDQNPYTVALIVPNKEAMKRKLKERGINPDGEEAFKEGLTILQEEIDHYRAGGKFSGQFPDRWLPAAAAVLDEAFSEENKFINSTMKMVRPRITEFYKERIDYLYTPEAKNIVNDKNVEAIQKYMRN